MYKTILLLLTLLIFSGCAKVKVNAAMCDQIAQDPETMLIPQECRPYIEADADKAFHKTDLKTSSETDLIKFDKE